MIAQAFTQAHAGFQPLPVTEALALLGVDAAKSLCSDDTQFLRLWPYRHATDGFFAAVWQLT